LPLRTTRCSSYSRRWYADGDSIAIPTLELRGVVEDVSLRRTKLRRACKTEEVIMIQTSANAEER